ncbi:MAG: prenyltransferase [Candidatus Caldarchaeales archaeon]
MTIREDLSEIIKISRFRFWIYTAGPYVVGYTLGATGFEDFLKIEYYIYLFYFFFPANILIYGINDYIDVETDQFNPKKDIKELRLTDSNKKKIKRLLIAVISISVLLMTIQDPLGQIVFPIFLLLSIFYSAPPLRFKKRPFLDFASNYLYIMPGIFGYYIVSGLLPAPTILLAGLLHTSSMHIFSAIIDVEYDKRVGIKTTPVFIGKNAAFALVTFFWIGLVYLSVTLTNFHPLSFLTIIYPIIPI